ncbi:MAG: Hsp20/alpha crystallin family protein [Rhodobacteraceae bacterium]|nr:Hsp20/alpha crystallin family protein [Paracoccaceae bacterium]
MIDKTPISHFWPSLADPFRQFGQKLAEFLSPASEASSDGDAYRISVELPGVAEDDIHVSMDDGVMTIRGDKRSSHHEEGDTWYFTERQYGSFSRSFRLPADADEGAIKAALRDGVLEVSIARKAAAPPESRRIPISKG